MAKKKRDKPYTTLAVGEEEQDGGLPAGIGIKTMEAGETAEDGGGKKRPKKRGRDDVTAPAGEEGEDPGR
jgi:hypothetical protein